ESAAEALEISARRQRESSRFCCGRIGDGHDVRCSGTGVRGFTINLSECPRWRARRQGRRMPANTAHGHDLGSRGTDPDEARVHAPKRTHRIRMSLRQFAIRGSFVVLFASLSCGKEKPTEPKGDSGKLSITVQ